MTVVPAGGRAGTVLVSDGGDGQGRSALAATRALAAAGYLVGVTTSGPARDSLAGTSRFCTATVSVPPAADTAAYADAMAEACRSGRWGWVMPASDAALLALRPEQRRVVDKAEWGARAAAAGLATPPTIEVADRAELRTRDIGAEVGGFPVVVKPTVGRAPAVRVDSPRELERVEAAGPLLVQPFLTHPMRSVAVVVAGGRLLAAVHQRYVRTWPVDCGTSSLAVTTVPYKALEDRLLELLSGFDGIAQLQLAGPYLLDVNARVYGSLPLAVRAGVNLAAIAVAAAEGHVDAGIRRAVPGVAYRWIEGDLRHLGAALATRRLPLWRVAAALLPHSSAAHSDWSLRDPAPTLTRLRVAAGRGIGTAPRGADGR